MKRIVCLSVSVCPYVSMHVFKIERKLFRYNDNPAQVVEGLNNLGGGAPGVPRGIHIILERSKCPGNARHPRYSYKYKHHALHATDVYTSGGLAPYGAAILCRRTSTVSLAGV